MIWTSQQLAVELKNRYQLNISKQTVARQRRLMGFRPVKIKTKIADQFCNTSKTAQLCLENEEEDCHDVWFTEATRICSELISVVNLMGMEMTL